MTRWALEGLALASRSQLDMAAHRATGRLVHVNPHWTGKRAHLHRVVPGHKQVTAAVRALRDHLVPRLTRRADGFKFSAQWPMHSMEPRHLDRATLEHAP